MHADYVTTDDVAVYDEQSHPGKNHKSQCITYTSTYCIHTLMSWMNVLIFTGQYCAGVHCTLYSFFYCTQH